MTSERDECRETGGSLHPGVGHMAKSRGGEHEGISCSPEAARMISAHAEGIDCERHSTRERVALALFALLFAVGGIVLISYIGAGHGLNVAATSIDEAAGDMAGYGVVLFEGMAKSEPSAAVGASKSSVPSKPMTLDAARDIYEEKGASVLALDSRDMRRYANGRIVMQGGHSYGIFSLTDEDVESLPRLVSTTTRTTTVTTESPLGLSTDTSIRVRDAFSSVSELFAAVDEEDIDPELVERIEGIVERFEAAGADTVIALTPSPVPFSAVEGVDVVVSVKESNRFAMSETIDGTLYVDAPEQGEVGVLMVAPGNVVSTKVLASE